MKRVFAIAGATLAIEHLASVGRRTAIERKAHYSWSYSAAFSSSDLRREFAEPLRQSALADALRLDHTDSEHDFHSFARSSCVEIGTINW